MTIPQNSNTDLIFLEDLTNTKMCPDCFHPLKVKQITLDEACRACFNEDCHTQSLGFPVIEYIQRSYRDLEIEESGQAFSVIPVSLEEEMQKIDKLFCEVESMVSHRLSEEEKNELKLLSISQSQPEELKSENITKESCDNPEFQIGCTDESSVNFKTGDAPILHFNQPYISSGIMTEVSAFDILQIEENISHQCPSTFIENSGIVYDEQLSRSETTNLSEMLPFHYEAKAEDIDFEIVSRVRNNISDLNPHQESISCGILTRESSLNTIVGSKGNLQLLNDGVSASDIKPKNSEIKQVQGSQSELFQAENKNRVENDNDEKETAFNEDKSDCKTDQAEEDFDFRVKVTNMPRCYRPRKEQRTVKVETETKVPLNCNLFNNWSDMLDTLKFEPSHSPVSDEVCETNETNDEYELFKDVDVWTDSQRSTSPKPSTPVKSEQNGGVCVSTLSQKSIPFSNDTNEVLHKGQSFITITLEDPQSINCAEGSSADVTENIQFIPKGKYGVTPKAGSSKKVLVPKTNSATSQMASLTLNDVPVPKVNSKAVLGFNELRNFGGAKCSLPAQRKKAKPVVKKSKKQKGNAKKTLSSVSNDASNVDAEIERAIENIQNTSGSELADWASELIEFLK